jgi:hypothetical protein
VVDVDELLLSSVADDDVEVDVKLSVVSASNVVDSITGELLLEAVAVLDTLPCTTLVVEVVCELAGDNVELDGVELVPTLAGAGPKIRLVDVLVALARKVVEPSSCALDGCAVVVACMLAKSTRDDADKVGLALELLDCDGLAVEAADMLPLAVERRERFAALAAMMLLVDDLGRDG